MGNGESYLLIPPHPFEVNGVYCARGRAHNLNTSIKTIKYTIQRSLLNGINVPISQPFSPKRFNDPSRRLGLKLDGFIWTNFIYPEACKWTGNEVWTDDDERIVITPAHLPL